MNRTPFTAVVAPDRFATIARAGVLGLFAACVSCAPPTEQMAQLGASVTVAQASQSSLSPEQQAHADALQKDFKGLKKSRYSVQAIVGLPLKDAKKTLKARADNESDRLKFLAVTSEGVLCELDYWKAADRAFLRHPSLVTFYPKDFANPAPGDPWSPERCAVKKWPKGDWNPGKFYAKTWISPTYAGP